MPSQHRWPHHRPRIPGPLWERTVAFAKRTGQTAANVVTAALGEYLDTHDRHDEEEQ